MKNIPITFMKQVTYLCLSVCLLTFKNALNAQNQDFKTNEISLGMGLAHSFENDPFNAPYDYSISSSTSIILSFLHNLDENFAVGLHVFGYDKTTQTYFVTTSSGTSKTTFHISTYNYGIQGRWIFNRGKVQPYFYGMVNYSAGQVTSDLLGTLRLSGYSLGAGGGAGIFPDEHFKVSLEGILSFGGAKWDKKPFSNSSGEEFNPSLIGILAILSYIWG